MTTEPQQIRERVDALLSELPRTDDVGTRLGDDAIDGAARRLEEAHDVLVRALESVEKG